MMTIQQSASMRALAAAALTGLVGLGVKDAVAAPFAFSLDAPGNQAGLISAAAPATPNSSTALFGGALTGDLDAQGFTLQGDNSFALASDMVLMTSGTAPLPGGSLQYTIETTLSGLTFDLSDAAVDFDDTGWLMNPMMTPTGGTLSSTIEGTVTVLGNTFAFSGTASGDVDHDPVQTIEGFATHLTLDPIAPPPGVVELLGQFEVQLGAESLSISGLDIVDEVAPIVAEHYDTVLTFTGVIDASQVVPEPSTAGMVASVTACLTLRRPRGGRRA